MNTASTEENSAEKLNESMKSKSKEKEHLPEKTKPVSKIRTAINEKDKIKDQNKKKAKSDSKTNDALKVKDGKKTDEEAEKKKLEKKEKKKQVVDVYVDRVGEWSVFSGFEYFAGGINKN